MSFRPSDELARIIAIGTYLNGGMAPLEGAECFSVPIGEIVPKREVIKYVDNNLEHLAVKLGEHFEIRARTIASRARRAGQTELILYVEGNHFRYWRYIKDLFGEYNVPDDVQQRLAREFTKFAQTSSLGLLYSEVEGDRLYIKDLSDKGYVSTGAAAGAKLIRLPPRKGR